MLRNWPYEYINVTKQGKQISYKQLNCIIADFGKERLNMDLHPHDLRRSYATHLLKSKINIKMISELMGHSSIETTSRYFHLTDAEISKVIDKIF